MAPPPPISSPRRATHSTRPDSASPCLAPLTPFSGLPGHGGSSSKPPWWHSEPLTSELPESKVHLALGALATARAVQRLVAPTPALGVPASAVGFTQTPPWGALLCLTSSLHPQPSHQSQMPPALPKTSPDPPVFICSAPLPHHFAHYSFSCKVPYRPAPASFPAPLESQDPIPVREEKGLRGEWLALGTQTQAGPGSSPGPSQRARPPPSNVWLCRDLGLNLILPHRLQELGQGPPLLFLPCSPPPAIFHGAHR